METGKWGIVYCPKAGITNKRKRWEKIQRILDNRHVNYDFVQSETSDSVERLMKMMISNGYKTWRLGTERCRELSDDGRERGQGEHRLGCHPQWRDERLCPLLGV